MLEEKSQKRWRSLGCVDLADVAARLLAAALAYSNFLTNTKAVSAFFTAPDGHCERPRLVVFRYFCELFFRLKHSHHAESHPNSPLVRCYLLAPHSPSLHWIKFVNWSNGARHGASLQACLLHSLFWYLGFPLRTSSLCVWIKHATACYFPVICFMHITAQSTSA
jgi:hypothetical protein